MRPAITVTAILCLAVVFIPLNKRDSAEAAQQMAAIYRSSTGPDEWRRYAWKQFEAFVETKDVRDASNVVGDVWGTWDQWKSKQCIYDPKSAGCSSGKTMDFPTLIDSSLEIPVQEILFEQKGLNNTLQRAVTGTRNSPDDECKRPNSRCASVLFNRIASGYILRNSLETGDTLKTYLPQGNQANEAGTSIQGLPVGSIVIKADWAPVPHDSPQAKLLKRTPDDPKAAGIDTVYFDIDLQNTRSCARRAYAPAQPGGDQRDPIPLGCFIHIPADLGDSGQAANGIRPQNTLGDVRILLGLHVARKEKIGWIWSTFWWVNDVEFDSARPANQSQLWAHYKTNATTTISGSDGTRIRCFNPYIEVTQHGYFAASNCVQCHSLAAYPSKDVGGATYGAPSLKGDPRLPSNFYNGTVRTDYLWSLADHF